MSVQPYYDQSWGNASQSSAALFGGMLAIAIALGLVVGALRRRRAWKQKKDSSLAPWAMCVVAGGVVAFGIAAINDSTRWIDGTDAAAIGLAGWIMIVAGLGVDRFRIWRKAGFPIFVRCPDCGKIRDFKMGRHRCRQLGRGFEVIQRR